MKKYASWPSVEWTVAYDLYILEEKKLFDMDRDRLREKEEKRMVLLLLRMLMGILTCLQWNVRMKQNIQQKKQKKMEILQHK